MLAPRSRFHELLERCNATRPLLNLRSVRPLR
jgi:hypothetical protein